MTTIEEKQMLALKGCVQFVLWWNEQKKEEGK